MHGRPTSRSRTLLVMAGGTGGHIMPALAVADELSARGWHVVWLGGSGGMETTLVPKHGYPLETVRFGGLRGKGVARQLRLPFDLARATLQCLQVFRRVRPDVVLGMGGYISFPGGMVATLLRRPLVLHEQNAIAGLANRVLARVARRCLEGFPRALPHAQWCGNPVRAAIAALPDPAARFAGRDGVLRLFVVGGSLGAQVLNEVVPQALATFAPAARPTVRHQAGAKHLDTLRANYAQAGVDAECIAFVDDMAAAIGDADLVICRAGALTVAELAAAGAAALLVPFPHAVDDHQTANARFLVAADAAVLVPQPEFTVARVAALIAQFGRAQLCEMARRARTLARPEAARTVADVCEAVAA
ncbi:MAG: undecaprenyldiphospho-muramoylpentapeptide beta-N-acetylglucosaminyltransferase [Burkholderiales bacterium]|jgi:UDP-N-acetylglucosamine--N-acetylmuramyl-(pentapeptide) pyrophosphoryl-undecaprenol N-acetylglucosamine transferase|nr:undecaprenyldiphospho-muramoylpentapeptide beta-N-acetylglucosaminyltransferase [Burkholderiales bacterium]